MSHKRKYIEETENEIENDLKLTPEEILKFGNMCYINSYYKCFDYDSSKNLHFEDKYPKKYNCGCKVIVYDNFEKDSY